MDALLSSAEKTPVVVERDVPGFIGNRIQAAMSYEAFSLLARGVATPEDIDTAVKAGFGFRLPVTGIFEKMDQSGLDIYHEVEKSLMPTLDRGTDPNPSSKSYWNAVRPGWPSGRESTTERGWMTARSRAPVIARCSHCSNSTGRPPNGSRRQRTTTGCDGSADGGDSFCRVANS